MHLTTVEIPTGSSWGHCRKLCNSPKRKPARLRAGCAKRCEGYSARGKIQNVSVPLNWIILGEASPPRNDPRMLVGVFTVLMIVPKFGLEMSPTG